MTASCRTPHTICLKLHAAIHAPRARSTRLPSARRLKNMPCVTCFTLRVQTEKVNKHQGSTLCVILQWAHFILVTVVSLVPPPLLISPHSSSSSTLPFSTRSPLLSNYCNVSFANYLSLPMNHFLPYSVSISISYPSNLQSFHTHPTHLYRTHL